ncbi:MAG: nucleotidyl transferase AbiEii/AbiGii toxin family protein [Ginsengibacter sp.]
MQIPALMDFSLVGGTALALKYGHRLSMDIDLFTHLPFKNQEIIEALESEFGNELSIQLNKEMFGVFGFIQNIKVDIVKHPHPLLKEPETLDGIRLYHIADIAAMKVNAILGRGKKKDFWDLAELLQHYTVENIAGFYTKKFPNQQLLISIPYALTWFDDAEESEDPVSLKGQTWESVKKYIQQKVSEFLR